PAPPSVGKGAFACSVRRRGHSNVAVQAPGSSAALSMSPALFYLLESVPSNSGQRRGGLNPNRAGSVTAVLGSMHTSDAFLCAVCEVTHTQQRPHRLMQRQHHGGERSFFGLVAEAATEAGSDTARAAILAP